jgi:uncharacterized delta-60 repeat protein
MDGKAHCKRVLATAILTALPALAQGDGELDVSFQYDGKYTLAPLAVHQTIRAVAAAPDEKIVVAGHRAHANGQSTLYWARIGDAGAPTYCTVATPGGGLDAGARAIAFDGNGRLLVAGSARFPTTTTHQGFVARFLYPSCSLDTTFDDDGVYHTELVGASVRFDALALAPNDRIVLAGSIPDSGVGIVVRLIGRYGDPDTTFDGDGVGIVEIVFEEIDELTGLAVQADSRILVGGTLLSSPIPRRMFALRLDPEGALDHTFAGDGWWAYPLDKETRGKSLLADPETGGVYLVGASSPPQTGGNLAVLVRLTGTGALDTLFADGGFREVGGALLAMEAEAGILQSDGRILFGGWAMDWENATSVDFTANRSTRDGADDITYHLNTVHIVPIDAGGFDSDRAHAVTLQGGRLVLAGDVDTGEGPQPVHSGAIVRLTSALVFTDGFERGSTDGWSAKAP